VLFAALLGVLALPCVARLFRRDRAPGMPDRHEDLGQVLMALGMILMLLSLVRLLPSALWLLLFGGQAVVFAVLLFRPTDRERDTWQYVHHVMASLAMTYMALTLGSPIWIVMPLGMAFAMYLLGYAALSGMRIITVAPAGAPTILAAPRLVQAGRTIMGSAMAFMLLR
jgi:hypothetical protein